MLIYASRLRGGTKESEAERNLKKKRKKFLTNDFWCAKITQLSQGSERFKNKRKSLKKVLDKLVRV